MMIGAISAALAGSMTSAVSPSSPSGPRRHEAWQTIQRPPARERTRAHAWAGRPGASSDLIGGAADRRRGCAQSPLPAPDNPSYDDYESAEAGCNANVGRLPQREAPPSHSSPARSLSAAACCQAESWCPIIATMTGSATTAPEITAAASE